MTNTLQDTLRGFGFSKNASKVAETLFHTHHGNATTIAKASGMPRTTVYGALSELVKRDVVIKKKIRGKYLWEIISPEVFARRLKESNNNFQNFVPKLSESYKINKQAKDAITPHFIIYQGEKEVLNSYNPLLSLKSGERIISVEGQKSIEDKMFKFSSTKIITWQEEIKKKGVIIESLTNEEAIKQFLKNPKDILAAHYGRTTIIWVLPDQLLRPSADIIVYRNTLLQVDNKRNIAIQIQSEELASTYRQLFHIAKKEARKIDFNQIIKEKLV